MTRSSTTFSYLNLGFFSLSPISNEFDIEKVIKTSGVSKKIIEPSGLFALTCRQLLLKFEGVIIS